MTEKKKWTPIICVDFDGVLHSYSSGWKGAGTIPDRPVEGAMGWLAKAVLSGKAEIAIYSSRSKDPEGIPAMKRWLAEKLTNLFELEHDYLRDEFFDIYPKILEWMPREFRGRERRGHAMKAAQGVLELLTFPTQKPAAIMTIDDRAHCFMGKFRPVEWYLNFKPWNKRSPEENVPDYVNEEPTWNDDDENLADQTLEVLLDCLSTDKDGFRTFEPSAQEYMASMFMEARKNADLPTTRVKKSVFPEGRMSDLREMFFEVLRRPSINSKCLDNQDERDAITEELLEAMRRFT